MAHISRLKNGLRNTRSLKNKPNELEKKIFTRWYSDQRSGFIAPCLASQDFYKEYFVNEVNRRVWSNYDFTNDRCALPTACTR